jgi:hypothetical protein
LHHDPFLRYLGAATVDDEPVIVEEDAAVAEVEADRAAGVPRSRSMRSRASTRKQEISAGQRRTDVVCTICTWQT